MTETIPHTMEKTQMNTADYIDWTFDTITGERVATAQTRNTTAAFKQAGNIANAIANQLKTTIAFTAWHREREGATAYRYPTKAKTARKG